jgi:hypothetical protein
MKDHPGKQAEQSGDAAPVGTQPKLVLPAPPTAEMPMYSGKHAIPPYSGKYPGQVRPEHLIRRPTNPTPKGPLAKLGYFWRKDPAYKAFIIAIAFVMVAAIFSISLASTALLGHTGTSRNNSLSQNSSNGASPTGTVDLKPAFPTPGGATGSTASSQPPRQSTPVLQQSPSPSPQPSQGPGGPLTVQITNIPPRVPDNSTVNVTVSTSVGGVNVRLVVRYNVAPYYYESTAQATDSQGNANLNWDVNVLGFGRNATATVVAVAMDQNGHVATSDPMTVQVALRGG